MRRPRHKPACETAFRFLRARKVDLAPLTGQDRVALEAWFHLVELWGTGDYNAEVAGVAACARVLDGMQRSVWPVAKAGIPAVLDWSHEERLWSAVHVWRAREGGDGLRARCASQSGGGMSGGNRIALAEPVQKYRQRYECTCGFRGTREGFAPPSHIKCPRCNGVAVARDPAVRGSLSDDARND